MNANGFSDLLVLKRGQIQFLVEVKGGGHSVHTHQRELHDMLKTKFGVETKIIRVDGDNIAEE